MNDDTLDFEALVNAPVVIPERKTVEDFAGLISASWQKGVITILECAELCWLASRQLSQDELQKLIRMLPFNKATFSKLKSMGSDPRMRENADRLPPNWTIISDLQRLPEPAFAKAISEGIVSPSLQRATLKKWAAANGAAGIRATTPTLATLPLDFFAGIRVPSGYPEERHSELLSALNSMCKLFEVQLVSQQDAVLAQAFGFMKAEASKIIRRERVGRKSAASKHQKASSWPYDFTEADVAKAKSPDDIKFMFQQLNMGIDYEALVVRAHQRVAQRIARKADLQMDDGTSKSTKEEMLEHYKEYLARKPKPPYLWRRKQVTDFAK
jgi:hypothetical protein